MGLTQYDLDNPKGKLALSLKDLKRLDMSLDDNLRTHAPGNIPASIEHEPA